MEKSFIKNIFLYGGPILICMGILKLNYYYLFFNIEIFRYVDLSEVITFFTGDLIIYAVLSIGSYLWSFLNFKKGANYNFLRMFLKYIKLNHFIERLICYISYTKYYVIFLLGCVLYFLFKYFNNYLQETFLIIFILGIVNFLIRFFVLEIKRKNKTHYNVLDKTSFKYEVYFFYLLRIFYSIFLYTSIEVQRVKYEHRYINSEIIFKDNIFKSDSTEFYIGHTANYIFVYNSKTDVSKVYPIDEVKEFRFGNISYLEPNKLNMNLDK